MTLSRRISNLFLLTVVGFYLVTGCLASTSSTTFHKSACSNKSVHHHQSPPATTESRLIHGARGRGGGKSSKIYQIHLKYMSLLAASPLTTKSVTAGIIQAIGDFLSQCIGSKASNVPLFLKRSRLQAFFISGTFFVGPFLHYWYNFLWQVGHLAECKYKAGKNVQTFLQVLTNQTLGVAIFFPLFFYVFELSDALCSWRGMLNDYFCRVDGSVMMMLTVLFGFHTVYLNSQLPNIH